MVVVRVLFVSEKLARTGAPTTLGVLASTNCDVLDRFHSSTVMEVLKNGNFLHEFIHLAAGTLFPRKEFVVQDKYYILGSDYKIQLHPPGTTIDMVDVRFLTTFHGWTDAACDSGIFLLVVMKQSSTTDSPADGAVEPPAKKVKLFGSPEVRPPVSLSVTDADIPDTLAEGGTDWVRVALGKSLLPKFFWNEATDTYLAFLRDSIADVIVERCNGVRHGSVDKSFLPALGIDIAIANGKVGVVLRSISFGFSPSSKAVMFCESRVRDVLKRQHVQAKLFEFFEGCRMKSMFGPSHSA